MDDKKFYPTVEWMEIKYVELNKLYFNGVLGDCKFNIFTSGKGSNGNVLGWFKISGKNIRIERSNGRMFFNSLNGRIYIKRDNFVALCKPIIELNGNYKWTENAMILTMIHEMCHYYTYMNGIAPKQSHGSEFKNIARIISERSNGNITIQRLASAEQMSEMELNDDIKKRNEQRKENKKHKLTALLVVLKNNIKHLTMTSSKNLIDEIVKHKKSNVDVETIMTSNDYNTIEILFKNGFSRNMRTYRYWVLDEKYNQMFNSIDKNSWNIIYDVRKKEDKDNVKERTFSLRTNRGEMVIKFKDENDLYIKLKEKLPKVNDEAIKRLMNNKNNYLNESIEYIIEKVLNEYLDNNIERVSDDSIDIDSSMNLGLASPFEIQ